MKNAKCKMQNRRGWEELRRIKEGFRGDRGGIKRGSEGTQRDKAATMGVFRRGSGGIQGISMEQAGECQGRRQGEFLNRELYEGARKTRKEKAISYQQSAVSFPASFVLRQAQHVSGCKGFPIGSTTIP